MMSKFNKKGINMNQPRVFSMEPSKPNSGNRRFPRLIAGLILASICAATNLATADLVPDFGDAVDAIAQELVDEGATPGMSIAIARGERILYVQGHGLANIDERIQASPTSIYRIGSVTKQFTAAAIMQLVEQGKLRLDDPLSKFFPNYPEPGSSATIYQLLYHTAGMKSFTALSSYLERVAEPVTHDDLISRFIDEPPDFNPGEDFKYNNSAYYLLGVIVEKISGQLYSDFLRERIFAPAGMLDTDYGADDYLTPRHAHGYKKIGGDFQEDDFVSMTQPFAAGALVSTVEDLIRWNVALRSGKVVSRESYYLMTTPGYLNSGKQLNYGFGLFISNQDWRRMVGHGGGIHGFTCTLNYFPDEDITIAILTNASSARPTQYLKDIANAIFTEETGRKFDVLIKGGTVVDGTGAERTTADIGITNGEIVAIGDLAKSKSRKTIDAEGLIVAPGFVDVHNHSDTGIALERLKLNEGFVRQGVTTVVGGPDGYLDPQGIRRLLDNYSEQGIATNVAFYIGHNGIRKRVMRASQQRPPTEEELEKMRGLVREGMELGAVGLSTGLMYEPGMYSTTEEVVSLAQEVMPFSGTYDSHVRNPVREFFASHSEAALIGREAGIPSKLGHLKGVGLQNAGVIQDVISMVEDQRAQGHVVVADQYPYDGAATSPLKSIVIIPPSLSNDGTTSLIELLKKSEHREAIRIASESGVDGGFAWLKATGYRAMRIVSSKDYPEFVGAYLSDLAEEREINAFDLVCELLLGANSQVLITLGAIKEEDLRELLKQPWNMVASDGSYTDAEGNSGQSHPRSTGTFPRVLGHYVRDEGVLPLEDAIRKMAWLPARHLGLVDRGRIALGLKADIVVFDPETIAAMSTWDEPGKMSIGVKHVLVNGELVLHKERLTGNTPGKHAVPSRRD
jgi:N-acyl-D-amino-acid deacylase